MTVGTGFPTENTSYAESTTGTDWTATALTVGGMFYYDTDSDHFGLLFEVENGGTSVLELFIDNGGGTDFLNLKNTATGQVQAIQFIQQSNWYLLFITKAAGSAVPRYHYTTDGSAWTHNNGVATAVGDFTFTQSRISFAAERISNVTAKGLKCEIATWGLWGEDTTDGTIETYSSYTTLAAKANAKFFTAESMINGGNFTDSANSNNETGGNHTTGAQTVPSWFTGFGGGAVPPTPITFQQVGSRSAGGTTSLTIAYPVTGLAAGDLFLVGRTVKPSTATVTTPPSPFTALANTTGGTGTQGIDTGPQRLSTEYLISPTGSETGNLTTAQAGSPDSANGCMIRFRKPPGTYWAVPVVATADDNSHGTARSAAGGAIDVQPGDMLCAYFGSDTDTTTAFTSATFTGTGLTTGTVTIDLGAGGVNTGQDSGLYITHALVTAATGSTAITATLAGGPSSCGPIHIIRLRAIYPVHYGRETLRPSRIVPILARRRR